MSFNLIALLKKFHQKKGDSEHLAKSQEVCQNESQDSSADQVVENQNDTQGETVSEVVDSNEESQLESAEVESVVDEPEESVDVEEEYKKIMEFVNPKKIKQLIKEVEYDYDLKQAGLFQYFAKLVNRNDEIDKELRVVKETKGLANMTREEFMNCPVSQKYFGRLRKAVSTFEKEQKLEIQKLKRRRTHYEFSFDKYSRLKKTLDCFTSFSFEDKARIVRLLCKRDKLSEQMENFLKAHILFKKEHTLHIVKDFKELTNSLYDKIDEEMFGSFFVNLSKQ